MKRIAILTHGGVEREGEGVHVPYLAGLIDALSRRHDITVFSPRTHGNKRLRDRIGGAEVRIVKPLGLDVLETRLLALAGALWREHRRRPFNVIHGIWSHPSGTLAVAMGKLLRVPSVVGLHGSETADLPHLRYGNLSRPLLRQATLWTIGRANAVIALSKHQARAVEALALSSARIHTIPPGVDVDRFAPSAEAPARDAVHLLHVANLTGVKDQLTLLEALVMIRKSVHARLRIVGADYSGGAIQQRARELGVADAVEFTGFVPHAEMPAQYRWADVFVQSSLHEASGIAVAEACAAGVPVCGTRVGTLHDLDGTAALATEPGDADHLAVAVLRLCADPVLRENCRAAAIAWAREHSIEKNAEAVSELYERL